MGSGAVGFSGCHCCPESSQFLNSAKRLHDTRKTNRSIICERAKTREPRCRGRARLLAYAGDGPDRKIAGNACIFAKTPARDAAFTQTLRPLRIAYGFKACGRSFRAPDRGGMEKARSEK